MKKDIKRDKKIIIVITILTSIIMTYGISKIFVSKKEDKEIIKEVKKEKTFAIMIQNGDTYKEYTSEDNKWPDENYIFSKAECVDNSGNRIEDAVTFNNETKKATLKSKKTIYCTLYFDESNIIKLRENEKLLNKNNLSPKPNQGGMYRYQGTDDVANWICFGTTDNCGTNDALVDKYMYRIIGITSDGELYLIKETFLKEGENTGFAWNDKSYVDSSDSNYCDNGLCPEWNTSLLFKRLNGTSNGSMQGTGTTSNKADTDIFVDSEYYDYLQSGDKDKDNDGINGSDTSSEWYNLIADHQWMYGDTNEWSTADKYNGDAMYAIEHGDKETTHYVGTQDTYKWNEETDSVTAKISLMYLHDYYYGYYDGSSEDSRGNSGNYEWYSTRWGVDTTGNTYVNAWLVRGDGVWRYSLSLNLAYGVRPVFYLSSKAKIAYGNGTKENPYLINCEEI